MELAEDWNLQKRNLVTGYIAGRRPRWKEEYDYMNPPAEVRNSKKR